MAIKSVSKPSPRAQSANTMKSTPRAQSVGKDGGNSRGASSVREGFGKAKIA